MVQVLIYEFTIGGVVINNDYFFQGTSITRTKDSVEGNVAKLVVSKSIFDNYTISKGMSVVVKRGTVTANKAKFKGRIYDIQENEGGDIEITCYDRLFAFKKLFFTKSYDKNIDPQGGEGSAIAKDIIENGGLSASVIDTGVTSSDVLLDKFISDLHSRNNRLSVLSRIYNYIFFDDYDNDWIRFEPEGSSSYPNMLVVGTNVFNVPVWNDKLTNMVNKAYVDGAYEEDTKIESFDGDNSTSVFTLDKTAETLKVTVDGVLQVLGVEGSSSVFDYKHDKELKTITFESGSIPASGTDNVVVEYSTLIPYRSEGQDDSSIDEFGFIKEETYIFKDIRTVEDSDTRLLAILDRLSYGTRGTVVETDEYDIYPGQIVSFSDINNSKFNGSYVVKEVTINYPEPVDSVRIGNDDFNINELFSTISERLAALESEGEITSDIIRQTIRILSSVSVSSRYTTIEKLSISGSTYLYWDSDTNGLWNQFNWADDSADVYDDSRKVLIQGDNTYREFVVDLDFVDSTSGVTVNTIDNQLEFVADSVIVLGPLSKNIIYSTFLATSGNIVGDLVFEISGDGKSTWQTITLGSSTLFDSFSSSDGVYVRISEDSSSVATLSIVKDSTGRFITPVVRLFMEE